MIKHKHNKSTKLLLLGLKGADMCESSGPVSTLPGHSTLPPQGAVCDNHPDKPAVRRVQGETDSFGAEFHNLCQECSDNWDAHREDGRCGTCDWCGNTEATDLRPRRDYEEGISGPVYDVCGACVKKENERLEEDEEMDYHFW